MLQCDRQSWRSGKGTCESSVCEKSRRCSCSDANADLRRLTPAHSVSVLQELITLVCLQRKTDGFGMHIHAALTVLAYLDACNKKTEACQANS